MTTAETNALLIKALRQIGKVADICAKSEVPLALDTMKAMLDDIAVFALRTAQEAEVNNK